MASRKSTPPAVVRGLLLISYNCLLICFGTIARATNASEELLSAGQLQKFVDEIRSDGPVLKGYTRSRKGYAPARLTIGMYKTSWKFHRDLPASTVFAYGTSPATASVPGPCIEGMAGVKTFVRWENHLPDTHVFPVDPTIEAARPAHGGVPTVVHLHGALVEPQSDGNPNAWFTRGFGDVGPGWKKSVYEYVNSPDQVNLFYHDHALGLTRLNLIAGLAGPYKIANPSVDRRLGLPPSPFDTFLAITDRSFTRDGSVFVNGTGIDPTVHPNWQPEYFGDVVIVNGKAWPFMKVQRRTYRFRIIDASNARYYRLALAVVNTSQSLPFTQIASDSFYLETPVEMTEILMGPGEISDVIVDFGQLAAGSEVLLKNSAPYPFPDGDATNDQNGKVMKFVVVGEKAAANASCSGVPPSTLVTVQKLNASEAMRRRDIVLTEETSEAGMPTAVVINFAKFSDRATEKVKEGTTEVWRVINLSADNHPFHVHLVAFQVVSEQALAEGAVDVLAACAAANKTLEGCHVESYYSGGAAELPEANVSGWKSVYRVKPGYVTTLVIRFAQTDGRPFPFDATADPGYVYHCHIVDHEDNVMMRPLQIVR